MPRMTDVRTVAANAIIANILTGKIHEFASRPSVVRLMITGAVAGMFTSFLIGGEAVVQDQEIGAANRFPIDPDDFFAEFGAGVGDRVVVQLRNSTGAGIVVQTVVDVSPIG